MRVLLLLSRQQESPQMKTRVVVASPLLPSLRLLLLRRRQMTPTAKETCRLLEPFSGPPRVHCVEAPAVCLWYHPLVVVACPFRMKKWVAGRGRCLPPSRQPLLSSLNPHCEGRCQRCRVNRGWRRVFVQRGGVGLSGRSVLLQN